MGEQVFGRYVNNACVKRGKELCKEAQVEHQKKVDYGKKEIYQAAKEGAVSLRNRARGKVMMTGLIRYRCCECIHNKINFDKCRKCGNGEAFVKQEEVANVS